MRSWFSNIVITTKAAYGSMWTWFLRLNRLVCRFFRGVFDIFTLRVFFWGDAEDLVTISEGKMEFWVRVLHWFPSVGTTDLETLDPQRYIWHSLKPSLTRSCEVGLIWARPKQRYLQCALKAESRETCRGATFSCPFAKVFTYVYFYISNCCTVLK